MVQWCTRMEETVKQLNIDCNNLNEQVDRENLKG